MKKFFNIGILFVALMTVACQEEERQEPSMCIAEGSEIQVYLGEKFSLSTSYKDIYEEGFAGYERWSSSDVDIVQLYNEHGTFYACGVGEAYISIESEPSIMKGEKFKASCHVTVIDMEVTSLELDTTSCVLFPNDKIRLIKTYEPSNASIPEFYWSSSDEDVATVNSEGEVSAVSVGECIITVKEGRSGLTAQCQITVVPVEMTSLELSETNCRIEIGETHSLVASFEPDSVTFPELYWHSSDESIATVSNGAVSAVGIGDCVISVTNADSSLTAQCNVSVYMIEITSISCAAEETKEQFDKFYLEATCLPVDATMYNDALRWHSSDESIAIVDELTGEVECVGIGACTITISNIYNLVTAECHLTVTPALVKKLSLNQSFLYLPIADSKRLHCTISPENAYNKDVRWESFNTSVATVSEDGTVTAVGTGVATIRVTALDGSGCTAECSVVVGTVGTLEEYVQDYMANNVSIQIIGSKWHESSPIMYFIFKITNNGDDTVYLKSANNRMLVTPINIEEYIGPGDTHEIEIPNYRELTWSFKMHGIPFSMKAM